MGECDSPLHSHTIYFPHPVRANHIRPLYIFIQFNGRIRFAPTYLHTYIYSASVRANRIRPLYIRPIYIPPFHPIHGRIRFAPTYCTHIYSASVRANRIRPLIYPPLYIFIHFNWANAIRPYNFSHHP